MNKKVLLKKLGNNEGASLMVALLFFVMCATIGSIILAAATVSSGRLKNLMESDQRYLAVTSAGDMVSEIISAKNADGTTDPNKIITLEAIYTGDGSLKSGTTVNVLLSDGTKKTLVSALNDSIVFGLLSNRLPMATATYSKENMQNVFSSSTLEEFYQKDGMSIIKGSQISIADFSDLNVLIDFYMNNDLDIVARVYQMKDGKVAAQTQLLFKAVKEYRTENIVIENVSAEETGLSRTAEIHCTYKIFWDHPEIYKNALE